MKKAKVTLPKPKREIKMSLKTVSSVLDQFEASKTVGIYQAMSINASTLFSGANMDELKSIINKISTVSNGSGLAIVSLLMWPDDATPESFNNFVKEITDNLSNI